MIWGLDLAGKTGHCLGDALSDPKLDSIRMPDTKDDIGEYARFFESWVIRGLDRLLKEAERTKASIVMVGFEAPILPMPKAIMNPKTRRWSFQPQTTPQTTRKLQGLGWELEKQCTKRRIECREMAGASVKKELAGHGRAEKTDMVDAAVRIGIRPKDHNEADALGVWLRMVRLYLPDRWPAWDQRLAKANFGAML